MTNENKDLTDTPARWARFGDFRLDFAEHEVFRGSSRLALPQQALRILELLVARHGELVTRDEIRQAIWRDRHVDFEAGLNTAIRKIRRALGDDAADPRLIETAPRRGYRFLATPAFSTEAAETAALRNWRARAAGAAAILLAAGIAMWFGDRGAQTPEQGGADLAELSSPGYEFFLQGRHAFAQSELDVAEARFEAAVAADPQFASAYAGLAHAKVLNRKGRLANIEIGQRLIDRALEIRPDLAAAHLLNARLALYYWRDRDAARDAIDRALMLAPSSAEALATAAYFHTINGRTEAAVDAIARAHDMSALSPDMNADYGWVLYKARNWPDAERMCKTSAQLKPGSAFALDCIIHVNHSQGDFAEAAEYGLKLMTLRGADREEIARLREISNARMREKAFWEWRLRHIEQAPRGGQRSRRGLALTMLGRYDEAVAAFDDAFDAGGDAFLAFFAVDPRVDELRSHAEFDRLAARSRTPVSRIPSASGGG